MIRRKRNNLIRFGLGLIVFNRLKMRQRLFYLYKIGNCIHSVHQWSGRSGFNPRSSQSENSKMVLDTALLNTQHYKVNIKGKVEQSREWSYDPLRFGVVAIKKGAFGSTSTKVGQLYFMRSYLHFFALLFKCFLFYFVFRIGTIFNSSIDRILTGTTTPNAPLL